MTSIAEQNSRVSGAFLRIPVRRVWPLIALATLLVCSFKAILSVNVLSTAIAMAPATTPLEQLLENEELYYSVSLPVDDGVFG